VDKILEKMIDSDTNMDVRDRARTALGNLNGERIAESSDTAANQVAAAVSVARSNRPFPLFYSAD
jgi:hypothetical protein